MEVATKIALWNAYQVGTKVSGVSKFDTSNFGTEETSAPSSIEMLASKPCKRITCAKVGHFSFRYPTLENCAEFRKIEGYLQLLIAYDSSFFK